MRVASSLILVSLLCLFPGACSDGPPAAQEVSKDSEAIIRIKQARKISNLAIRNRDSVAVTSVMMDNFQIITSRDYETRGKADNGKSFASMFKTDAMYVRTPVKVDVMEAWGMASEYGTWVGNLNVDGDAIEIKGTYYAKWHEIDGKWLLRAEVFTPTECKGGAYCKNRPINE